MRHAVSGPRDTPASELAPDTVDGLGHGACAAVFHGVTTRADSQVHRASQSRHNARRAVTRGLTPRVYGSILEPGGEHHPRRDAPRARIRWASVRSGAGTIENDGCS